MTNFVVWCWKYRLKNDSPRNNQLTQRIFPTKHWKNNLFDLNKKLIRFTFFLNLKKNWNRIKFTDWMRTIWFPRSQHCYQIEDSYHCATFLSRLQAVVDTTRAFLTFLPHLVHESKSYIYQNLKKGQQRWHNDNKLPSDNSVLTREIISFPFSQWI